MRLVRASVIVGAAKQCDFFVSEASIEEQLPQVLLGGDRLGEDHGLATGATVTTQI